MALFEDNKNIKYGTIAGVQKHAPGLQKSANKVVGKVGKVAGKVAGKVWKFEKRMYNKNPLTAPQRAILSIPSYIGDAARRVKGDFHSMKRSVAKAKGEDMVYPEATMKDLNVPHPKGKRFNAPATRLLSTPSSIGGAARRVKGDIVKTSNSVSMNQPDGGYGKITVHGGAKVGGFRKPAGIGSRDQGVSVQFDDSVDQEHRDAFNRQPIYVPAHRRLTSRGTIRPNYPWANNKGGSEGNTLSSLMGQARRLAEERARTPSGSKNESLANQLKTVREAMRLRAGLEEANIGADSRIDATKIGGQFDIENRKIAADSSKYAVNEGEEQENKRAAAEISNENMNKDADRKAAERLAKLNIESNRRKVGGSKGTWKPIIGQMGETLAHQNLDTREVIRTPQLLSTEESFKQAEAEASDKAGLLSSDKTDFGPDGKQVWINNRASELMNGAVESGVNEIQSLSKDFDPNNITQGDAAVIRQLKQSNPAELEKLLAERGFNMQGGKV